MTRDQLTAQYQRLQRKLQASGSIWPSGRLDRLMDALRAVERELMACGSAAA